MSLKSLFFADGSDELTTSDAIRLALQCIAFGIFLAYFFGPTEYGFWGLLVKAASFFGVLG